MSVKLLFVIFINIFTVVSAERSEIFSSAERLKGTLDYVKTSDFLPYLQDFVESRKVWLSRLSKVIQDIDELDKLLLQDKFSVEIPTYAYKFIRRQALISQEIHRFMHDIQRTAFDFKWMNDFMDHLPNSTDLVGSSQGLTRLAQTYRLQGKDVLNGTIYGYNSKPLSAKEIFDIAKSMTIVGRKDIREREFQAVLRWLDLARFRLMEEDHKTLEESAMIELKLKTYITVGCLCSIEVAKLVKNSTLPLKSFKMIRNKQCKNKQFKCNPRFDRLAEVMDKSEKSFEALCRGDIATFEKVMGTRSTSSGSLRCYLVANRDPRLLLQPVKMEEVHKAKPEIAILHDVLRDREIDFFVTKISPMLERGQVRKMKQFMTSPLKISQQAYLRTHEYDNEIVNLRNRLAAATKLNVEGFDDIQVVNYAAGGYYYAHFDSLVGSKELPANYLGQNNRIATIIMYLNDVEKGGETTFPIVGASISPIKGSAAVFYNVNRSLITDLQALHGGCPIVLGEKWIATQWVSTFHQEFHRPCTLNSAD